MKKIIVLLLLFVTVKFSAQTTAAYLSGATQPWTQQSNITALFTVYNTDWTHYTYGSVTAATLFDPARKFVWIDGSDMSTNQMQAFYTANSTEIQNWVSAGGTLLISTATNQVMVPYDAGFGITSSRILYAQGYPADTTHPFFVNSPYLPIATVQYNGGDFSHNIFSGPGLDPIIRSAAGETILGEKNIGAGLVIFSGMTTSWFDQGAWNPKPEILNVLYRMISLRENPLVSTISPTTISCSGSGGTVQFTVNDNLTPVSNLVVTATSSNTGLIANSSFSPSIAGNTVTLAFASTAGQTGTSTITVNVADEDGNTTTRTFIATVQDIIPPVVVTQNISVVLDATGHITLTPGDIDNGSTDNCGIASMVLTTTTLSFENVGANTIGLIVTDTSGNVSIATAIVTIPLTCPVNITVGNDLTSCGATVVYNTPGAKRVLLLAADGNGDINDVRQKINAVGYFNTVDTYNTQSGTPTLNYLKQYDAVLVWNDSHALDEVALGNVLAQYIDNGGGVVDAVFDIGSIPVLGAYNTAAYRVLTPGGQLQGTVRTLGAVSLPSHPIMEGVTSFNGGTGSYRSGSAAITPGSYVIARYDNSEYFILGKENVGPLAVRRASLNFLPVSADALANSWVTSTSGALIMANALRWVANSNTVVQTAGLESGSVFPVGTTTNTFESTDELGNVETCSFDVVVNDTELPTVLTQNITVQLNAAGTVAITPAQIENGSTDNCAIDTYALDVSTFTCADVGVNPVVLTVTDIHGNSGVGPATVTVQDVTVPVVTTQNITVQLDATGNVTITSAQIDNGSTDACGIATSTLDISTFNCTNIGTPVTVTLTVTDVNGNTATGTAIVTVEDTVAPAVVAQNITVQLDATGNVTITPVQIDNGSTDACSIATMTLDATAFDCTDIGTTNTVTLTVTDIYGNSATGTATVTVQDVTAPVVATQDITVQLDATGNVTITAAQIDNGSTDACGIATTVLNVTTFTCANVGANTITLTITDINGNVATGTATVTVQDITVPAVTTQDITVQLDVTGNAVITPAQIDNGSADACGIATTALDVTAFTCANLGANTVTLTVTDVNGNAATGTAIVTVEDVTNPIAITQDITVQLDATGNVTITPAQIDNGSSDACGAITLGLDAASFNCSNIGINTVILAVTDASGNIATQTATVTVQDVIAPTVVTQNIAVQLDATGNITITESQIDNGSADACGIATTVLDITTFTCANVGANTVTLTVTDVNGNSASQTAIVTVQDVTPPTVITQNITVQLDATGNVTITPAQIDNGSTDACGIGTMALDSTTFNCSNIGGVNTVTLTVRDVNGNVSTGTAVVSIEDTTAPVVLTQNITVPLNAAGTATITPTQIDNGSSDTCGGVSLSLDVTAFDCSDVGTNTVTLTATDANGNTATGTAIVTIVDTIAPVVITQDITVPLDATGNIIITPAQIDNGSSDACGITARALDITAFDCSDIGTPTMVTLTVTDANGNSSTGIAMVTVVDVTPPVVVAQDITIQLDTTGNTMITAADIDNGSYDNCGIASMSIDVTSFDCSNIGVPNYVALTVTDIHGNSATATGSAIVTIIIEDVTPPVIITQDITVELDASGNASITPDQIENGSYDACGIQGYTLDTTTFNCADLGANTVNLIVTDNSNNTGSAPATVTVLDVTPPVVATQNITVQLDPTGSVTITPAQINNGSTDACGITAFTLDRDTFDCTNVSVPNTVILTATDASGNSATGTAVVTVVDVTPPVLVVQNIQAPLDATGHVTITPADIDNGSYDNCAIAGMSININTFSCEDYGPNQVIITATDTSGLTSTATVIVTVVDQLPPVVVTQNITVELGPIGTAQIISPMINNGSTDNCGIAGMLLDVENFDCDDIGANPVVLTVIDIHGNSATGPAVVTIVDTMAPVVHTFPVILQLDANGTAAVTAAQVDHGSIDNCGIANMVLDVTTFDCNNIGTNIVNLTVTDVNGNVASATGVVMVEEHVPPTVITQPFTLLLDTDGVGTITTADVDNGSFDNCGITVMHLDRTDFTCADLGVNEVVLTVFDTAGNSAFKPAQVTVVDDVAPIAIAQNLSLMLNPDGEVTIQPSDVDNGSTDNCSFTLSLDRDTFNCSDIGTPVTITLTATDQSGNTDTATATVTILPVPVPTTVDISQTFCFGDRPTIASISVDDPATVVWYGSPTDTTPLNPGRLLTSGTYYAVNIYGACSSTGRLAVNVTISDVTAPTGKDIQYVCIENNPTVSNLEADQPVVWYDSMTGGQALSPNTPLEHGRSYYAAQTGSYCESIQRLKVSVILHNCDVVVNNAVSANNDGKNDYLLIEGIENFKENHVEIFNRWGSKVFETSNYGINDNYFRGYPNTGVGASDTAVLPFGTYYYVLEFVDHNGKSQNKTGYIHLNH